MIALRKGDIPGWVLSNQEPETANYVAWRNRANDESVENPGIQPSPWRRDDIKKALTIECNGGKCVYCESHIGQVAFDTVEHYRPKRWFPDAVLLWENLGLACPRCNLDKGAEWSEEEPIIWPYQDDPSEHFSFNGPFLIPKTQRGRTSLEHIKLNARPRLIERRAALLSRLEREVDTLSRVRPGGHVEIVRRAILESTTVQQEYSAFAKAYLAEQGISTPNA
jgi:uncharacterized protein (TIGR02646 family)